MGITIIQKSDLGNPKPRPKTALVLAGGAVSGAAFKLGGLMALNRFMLNQRITNFDMYVGTSAGAIISVYLANGIPPREIIRSLEGRRGATDPFYNPSVTSKSVAKILDPIRASEFYYLNYKDFVSQPLKLVSDALQVIPKSFIDFVLRNNLFQEKFRGHFMTMLNHPTAKNCENFVNYCLGTHNRTKKKPEFPWHYLPNGIFTTEKFECSTRRNLRVNDLSNDFKELYDQTGRELHIVTTELNTAKRKVFNHHQSSAIPISKALQASIAIPLFYKPVRIGDTDYVDGAVAKTTSIDWAVDNGADLIICYNPFRPFNHESYCLNCGHDDLRCNIADDGIYAVLNQVMRALLHTRLMNGLDLRKKDPDFKGDIILVEPSDYDDKFFDMNPLAFWERRKAARRGYESVKESIGINYRLLSKILNTYGIDTSTDFIKEEPQQPAPAINTFYENLFI
ncbi:patatin-like phospholipase family protein [Desulfobacterales bacterium HSG16]|nr:patatin-like phospholipase family protein [Desulfobacterales bacterium HSG16]